MKTGNDVLPWAGLYLLAAALVFWFGSQFWGIALFLNAVIALVIGMIARGMGKQEGPAVLLGLLLGPLGALAGMMAARPR